MTLHITQGMRRMVRPIPQYLEEWKYRRQAARVAAHFDTPYYLRANPDVRASGVEPVLHYVKFGWREGRDPSPSFSTRAYLEDHPEASRHGGNPFSHFLRHAAVEKSDTSAADLQAEVEVVAREIDANFYRRSYPAAAESGLDPAVHYCLHGWRSGLDPTPEFSTNFYLNSNPDIKQAGLNPFWHFLMAGRDEGRAPKNLGGWRIEVIEHQPTMERIKADWRRTDVEPATMDFAALSDRLQEALTGGPLVVSIGHDDYRTSPGGVQLCIGLEAKSARAAGVDYLNLHPWQPLPTLADIRDDPILGVVLNGETIGHARSSEVVKAAGRIRPSRPHLVCHHLAGHSPEATIDLAQALGVTGCHLWLHDNFTLCTSFALQRNNVAYCGAPDAASNACTLCLYGAERQSQTERFQRFFEALEVHLVSPSQVALRFWERRCALQPASVRVNPHLFLRKTPAKAMAGVDRGSCRIAFVGSAAPYKGWPVFETLQRKFIGDERFEFWMFGHVGPADTGARHVPLHVDADDPHAAIRALERHGIDLVLHWASCPETFSFSTHEAIAAGAFVVTNEGSGNVADVVRRKKCGCVLRDEEELFAMARDGRLLALADEARAERRRHRHAASFSDFSLDLLSPAEVSA